MHSGGGVGRISKRGEGVSNTEDGVCTPQESHRAVPGVDGRPCIDKVNGRIQGSSHDSPVQSRVAVGLRRASVKGVRVD